MRVLLTWRAAAAVGLALIYDETIEEAQTDAPTTHTDADPKKAEFFHHAYRRKVRRLDHIPDGTAGFRLGIQNLPDGERCEASMPTAGIRPHITDLQIVFRHEWKASISWKHTAPMQQPLATIDQKHAVFSVREQSKVMHAGPSGKRPQRQADRNDPALHRGPQLPAVGRGEAGVGRQRATSVEPIEGDCHGDVDIRTRPSPIATSWSKRSMYRPPIFSDISSR